MKNSEVDAKVTLDQMMEILKTNKNASLEELRSKKLDNGMTVKEAMELFTSSSDRESGIGQKIAGSPIF